MALINRTTMTTKMTTMTLSDGGIAPARRITTRGEPTHGTPFAVRKGRLPPTEKRWLAAKISRPGRYQVKSDDLKMHCIFKKRFSLSVPAALLAAVRVRTKERRGGIGRRNGRAENGARSRRLQSILLFGRCIPQRRSSPPSAPGSSGTGGRSHRAAGSRAPPAAKSCCAP